MVPQFSNFPIRTLGKSEFPACLSAIEKPPERLYYRGTVPPFFKSWIALVGTRRPGPYAEDICQDLVKNLRGTDAVIVSGLAQGIDSFCHEAALRNGISTVAVIAQGLDVGIGGSRARIADDILKAGGAILSEYPESTPPLKFMFPARNRIIAGLSKSVTLIESKLVGGSLITAEFAKRYRRKVLGVPGNILVETSQGVNRRIRDGEAEPVWDPVDFPDQCGAKRLSDTTLADLPAVGITLGHAAQKLFRDHAGYTYALDALCERSGLGAPAILAILTELEMAGLVHSKGGGAFHFSMTE